MESARNRLSQSKPPAKGVARDLERLKTDGQSSIGELREFMARLQGKSPQEMLGVVAESRLAMSIVWSTVGCAALLLVFTIGPYWWNATFAAGNDATVKKAAQPADRNASAANTPPVVAGKTNSPPAGKTADIAKKLGHKDVKSGSPNLEKLLDGDK